MVKDHSTIQEEIDRLFVRQGLSARRWRRVHGHLAECAPCRGYYQRVAELHVAFTGRSWQGSLGMAGIESSLLVHGPLHGPLATRWWSWLVHSFTARALVAVASLAILLLVLDAAGSLSWRRSSPTAPGFERLNPRGGASTPASPARLRPICVLRSELTGDTPDENGALSGRVTRCTMESDLVFAYLYDGDPDLARYVFVVGLDDRLTPLWYGPRPDEQQSLAIAAAERGVVYRLPGATRVGVNHQPGRVRAFALFSPTPVRVDEVAAAVRALRDTGVSPTSLVTLPLLGRTDVVTAVADLEVVP